MKTAHYPIASGMRFLEESQRRGMRTCLEPVRKICAFFGDPQDAVNSVHIAGSNGKGSTAAMIESILRAGGYRTGLYTSPHLISVHERIRVGGIRISPDALSGLLDSIAQASDRCRIPLTYFEVLTCAAFLYFRQTRVQIAIIEVGMGGRWDATNVVKKPVVCVLTSLAREHQQYLGESIAQILAEKSMIIKEGCRVVAADPGDNALRKYVSEVCRKNKATGLMSRRDFTSECLGIDQKRFSQQIRYKEKGRRAQRYTVNLIGMHQAENAGLAISTVTMIDRTTDFHIRKDAITAGLKNVRWDGRLQRIICTHRGKKIPFIIDGAHNPRAMEAIAGTLKSMKWSDIFLVFGVLKDKDHAAMMRAILPLVKTVRIMALQYERGLCPDILINKLRGMYPDLECKKTGSWIQLLEELSAIPDSRCLVTGSLYLVGDCMRFLRKDMTCIH